MRIRIAVLAGVTLALLAGGCGAARRAPAPPHPVDVTEFAADLARVQRVLAATTNVELAAVIAEGPPVVASEREFVPRVLAMRGVIPRDVAGGRTTEAATPQPAPQRTPDLAALAAATRGPFDERRLATAVLWLQALRRKYATRQIVVEGFSFAFPVPSVSVEFEFRDE